jgi:SAM-dependent methyltransferase
MIRRLRKVIYDNKKLADLNWAVRGLFGITRRSLEEKYFRKHTSHIIPNYMKNNDVKRLQIGGGNNVLDGWLNVNIYCGDRVNGPESFKQAYMDATKTFPFAEETFQYIFSEHMIEHISYKEADFMISECNRVMKKGGRIRICTPGYDNLVNILTNNSREDAERYFKKLVHGSFGSDIPTDPSYAINYMFFNYGHRFIHSKASLSYLLKKHGFSDIEFFKAQQSNDPELKNIETNYIHTGHENNAIETLAVEAVRK